MIRLKVCCNVRYMHQIVAVSYSSKKNIIGIKLYQINISKSMQRTKSLIRSKTQSTIWVPNIAIIGINLYQINISRSMQRTRSLIRSKTQNTIWVPNSAINLNYTSATCIKLLQFPTLPKKILQASNCIRSIYRDQCSGPNL